jgi:hypothetical protein
MCIYLHIKKWNIVPQQTDVFKTPPPHDIDVTGVQGTLSSATASMSIISQPPKMKRIQMTANAAQQIQGCHQAGNYSLCQRERKRQMASWCNMWSI